MTDLVYGIPIDGYDGVDRNAPDGIDYAQAFLRVVTGGIQSTLNTKTTPLTASQTDTGEGEQNNFPHVAISFQADTDCRVYFDFSNDNENWTTYPVVGFYHTAGGHTFHVAEKLGRYFRCRVAEADGVNQTERRQYIYYGHYSQPLAALNQSLGLDADAIAVRPTDFYHEVNQNLRAGHAPFDKWGYNAAIGTSFETAWSYPSGNLVPLTNAELLDVAFPNTADRDGSTGLHGVVLYGVGDGWVNQTEVVLATSATVRTTKTWLGINRMAAYRYGSGQVNAGNITATSVTSATVQAYMPAGQGTTQQAFFFVPVNSTGQFNWLTINAVKLSGGGQPVITTRGKVFSSLANGYYNVFEDDLDTEKSDFHVYQPPKPFPVAEKSIFIIDVKSDTASSKANIRFSCVVSKNFG